jgi:DNA-binding MarR family transcriptional regulator
MSLHAPLASDKTGFLSGYLDTLSMVERLHRLLLDVIKDEFERVGVLDINAVQALLLFNIGDHEVTAGELKTRGYYQGSNVSYNLKKLVEMGYMHHQRCEIDRRSVRVRLTERAARCATRWRSFSPAMPRGWNGRACWRPMAWTG